ncbi:hypothetical protein BGZ70_007756 [Mortierella alpina]|uniref:UBC core domain-containing protein n=1 Tax=Mortierella alpina TaxID=64518 RepID=A0A9P6J534_MORAP|nr:hypothetical protein BGZ70_007756 [Mortierella alpina]
MAKALITAKIFLEDAVHSKDNPDRLGLVVRTWHDFESGESDSEDDVSSGPIGLQQVVVHWCDGSAPQTLLEEDLVVADRSFSHGDVVKKSPNDIMSGSVIGVKVELDVERVCPPMTQFLGIDAQHVDFVQQFAVNNHIIYDGWLGVIEEVEDEVTVLLSDKSVCVIKNSDDLDLRDQIHDQSCFFPDHLAPGHAVCGPSRIFKNAKYIVGSYSGQKSGYVARTEVISITVNWLSFNPLALDQTPGVAPPPRVLDDFENIVVYKSVEQHCTYELMDRVKVIDPDTLKALGLQEYCPYLKSKTTRLQCPDKTHDHDLTFATEEMRVIGTKTRVTVQWQDLSVSTDVYSTELVPYLNIDDQDVWPSDYVLLKEGEVLTNEPGGVGFDRKKSDMLGIVQSVNAKERTTLVKWFSEERDQGLEQDTEECSLYEIMSHPDLKFRMGDKVIVSREREQSPSSDIAPRAPSVDDVLTLVARGNEICNELQKQHRGSEVFNHKMIERRGTVLLERYGVEGVEALDRYLSETNKMASTTMYWLINRGDPLVPAVPEETLATFTDLERDIETIRTRLNWIGQIWEVYRDRPSVLVRFMDGTTEEVPVGRIMVVEDDDEDEADDASEVEGEFEEYDFDQEDGEEISSDDSWETDSGAEDDSMSDIEEDVSTLRTDKTGSEDIASDGDNKENSPLPQVNGHPSGPKRDLVDNTPESRMRDPLSEPEDVATSDQGTSHSQRKPVLEHEDWKSFLVAEATPEDHHFLQSHPVAPHSDKAWIKRVVKEHSILSSSLPEGIRVRAFEDRMDLLRVLIQGPDHTPYRNALFLFDFMLPSQFPSQPPAAFFHSWTGGIGRINPNLYEDGNVCLSLLNTWHGKDQTETWTPSSSLLQLLISLQGLVLVPEPYYNEAGFEKFVGTREAARNSELYNEKVYLLSLKAVQTILNNPPTPFQKEVRHFYFKQGKLEQIVIEGLELIARSEANSDPDGEEEGEGSGSGSEQEASSGPVMKRISKGALKMLKKHIDNLSLSLEE